MKIRLVSDYQVEVLTGEKLEAAMLNTVKMAFSYLDGDNFVFTDQET